MPVKTIETPGPITCNSRLRFTTSVPRPGKSPTQLDGPTGLPTEGNWYANKVGPGWGIYGLRDVLVSFDRQPPSLVQCTDIANAQLDPPWQDQSLTFIGVDAQYFSSVLIPQKESPEEIWFARSRPIRVGAVDGDFKKIDQHLVPRALHGPDDRAGQDLFAPL